MAKFKQACYAHSLSKMFQIFAAVHKLNVFSSATKILLSDLSPNMSAYYFVLRKEDANVLVLLSSTRNVLSEHLFFY